MSLLELAKRIYPLEPLKAPAAPDDWAAWKARQILARRLAAFTPDPSALAERLLAPFVIAGQAAGLTVPAGPERESLWLLAAKAAHAAQTEVIAENAAAAAGLLAAIAETCRKLDQPPYNELPTWAQAPVLRWLYEYAGTPIFFSAGLRPHLNLLAIIRPGLESGEAFRLQKNVYDLTWALLRYAHQLDGELIADFQAPAQARGWMALFEAQIAANPPPDTRRTQAAFRTYLLDIARLLMDESLQGWQPRSYGGRRKTSQVEYDQLPEDDPERAAFLKPAAKIDAEAEQAIAEFEDPEDLPQEPDPKDEAEMARRHFADPWPQTMWRNVTYPTRGVPTLVEVTFALQGTYDLTGQDHYRATTARLVLLAGLLYGWTEQLRRAETAVTESPPDKHPGLVFRRGWPFVSLKPQIPVGWPERLSPGKADPEAYLEAVAEHRRAYEPVEPVYCLHLHPALAHLWSQLDKVDDGSRPLPSAAGYRQALKDLNAGLQRYCPHARNLTPGRLFLGYRGYTASDGLDEPAAYLISGRALTHQEMPLNYTRIGVYETNLRHWQFVDRVLDQLKNQHRFLAAYFDWPPLVIEQASQAAPDPGCSGGHAGSWSVPRRDLVRDLFAYVSLQCRQAGLPEYERENYRLRWLGLAAAFLLLMRDFEINRLALPPDFAAGGESIAHPAKQKHVDRDTFTNRHLPEVIRQAWWERLTACAYDYSSGPVWCLRGPGGERRPFDLQSELDGLLQEMGAGEVSFRAYGLRHLGRTEHRNFDFPEPYLNFKMNHDGLGYERFNPARLLGYARYREADEQVTRQIAQAYGITGVVEDGP